jgi:hypothetical protein
LVLNQRKNLKNKLLYKYTKSDVRAGAILQMKQASGQLVQEIIGLILTNTTLCQSGSNSNSDWLNVEMLGGKSFSAIIAIAMILT